MSSYEEGFELLRRLEQACAAGVLTISHSYRAYNANADSLANNGIDLRVVSAAVVNDNWGGTQLPDDMGSALQ